MKLAHFTVALSDPVSVRAIVATAASHLSTMKLNRLSPLDRKRIEQVKDDEDADDALYHMSDGVRVLNERFRDPKQALTVASLVGVSLLGVCAVRKLLRCLRCSSCEDYQEATIEAFDHLLSFQLSPILQH